MLSQCESLVREIDCRYATDAELIFLLHYRKSYPKRFSLYKKIGQLEQAIVDSMYKEVRKKAPQILHSRKQDISSKWKQDALRTMRYCATAVLLDDANSLQNKYLLWFQTVMDAFNSRHSCDITYAIMQEVVQQLFTAEEVAMLLPMVQLAQATLGTTETTQLTKL